MPGSQLGRIINRALSSLLPFLLRSLALSVIPISYTARREIFSFVHLQEEPRTKFQLGTYVRVLGYLVFASASYLNICPTCFALAFTVRFYHLACLRVAPLKMHVNVASMSLDVCSISPRSDTFKTRTIFVSKASAY